MKAATYLLGSAAAVALLTANPVMAQTANPPTDTPAPSADQPEDVIVVVGTSGAGARRQDAAFAVTTLDEKALERLSPASTADVFKLVPGISTESSGGQNGANIFVRGYPSGGDAEFVTIQSQGVPFFPPSTLSFLENTQLIRVDETIKRVEAVRGGTGALFSSGQPGLTMNFVQREGGSTQEGKVKLSATTYGELRGDAYVSGPLGPDTSYMVGGYYATGHGIRDPKFTAERGGQITANIRHDFAGGNFKLFGRYLNDHGQWLLTIPVVQDGSKISQWTNFSSGTGTLQGPETRRRTLQDGQVADLGNGRGAKLVNLGGSVDYELGSGVTLRDRASWLKGSADTTGLVPGGAAPQTAAEFAAGLGGTVGQLRLVNGGGTVAPSQQVLVAGSWIVEKDIKAFVNDLSLEFKSGHNTLTGGFYYTTYSSKDRWNLGNNQLLTAEPNGRLLDMTLADGRQVTLNGFTGGSFFNVNAAYDGRDIAGYLVDEFQITDALRIDAGVRYQDHKVTGRLENNNFGVDTDGNPNTLYNNGSAVLNGTFSKIDHRSDAWSWTVGANYAFNRQVGAFLRYSRGNSFPFFDNLRDGVTVSPKVDTYEGGLKVTSRTLDLYATLFHNKFDGLVTTVIAGGAPVASIGGARATGLEIEGAVRPAEGLQIAFAGTYLDSVYDKFFTDGGKTDLSGKKVQRQPKWQWRVTPSYSLPFGDNRATIYTTAAYTGDRFSDVKNLQTLPHFLKWDAGVTFDVGEHLSLQASVDNITNVIGLTEGNPRNLGSQGAGVILARPILGRSGRFSVSYKF